MSLVLINLSLFFDKLSLSFLSPTTVAKFHQDCLKAFKIYKNFVLGMPLKKLVKFYEAYIRR